MADHEALAKKFNNKITVDKELAEEYEMFKEKKDDDMRTMQFTINTLKNEVDILKTIAKPDMIKKMG